MFDWINAAATLITGGVAIFIYIKQRRDYKKEIANTLVIDIRNAEKVISEMKKNNNANFDFTKILPINNWEKYQHLFSRAFNVDEFTSVNNFFSHCEIVQTQIRRIKDILDISIKAKAEVMQAKLAEYSSESGNDIETYNNSKKDLQLFEKDGYVFIPLDPQERLLRYISDIDFITNSSAFNKLKKIAKME